ncbi:MAG: TIGR02266 family protein [Archangium gephyra]|uniref:TIGR02266 family protein n=1 Tax=Archangium gephyra TaxID=48 RepID=A0A2W5VJS4_9BACT|nr:MAG: TIGR02266 family protein [Archangium gephyra]
MSDNRKFQRVTSKLRCWCEGENITVYARIGNLSEGGIFLRTSTPLERGSKAMLRFGTDGVQTPARVVWSRVEGQGGPAGMGLEFEGADERIREAIRQLIDEDRPVKVQASN